MKQINNDQINKLINKLEGGEGWGVVMLPPEPSKKSLASFLSNSQRWRIARRVDSVICTAKRIS